MIFVFHHFPCWEVPKSAPEKAVPEQVGMAKGAVPRSFLFASLKTSDLESRNPNDKRYCGVPRT